MKSSAIETLDKLAKGSVVSRPDGTQVNMSSPTSVAHAKNETRLRANKIRQASPLAGIPNTEKSDSHLNNLQQIAKSYPKTIKLKTPMKEPSDKPCPDCGSSYSEHSRGGQCPSNDDPQHKSMAKKSCCKSPKLVAKKAAGASPDFDMEAFDRENPVLGSEGFEPMKERPIPKKTSKVADMTSQENKMKSTTKKSVQVGDKLYSLMDLGKEDKQILSVEVDTKRNF